MHEAQDVCHHWIAHVLPLYALLFPKDAGTATQLIVRVRSMAELRLAEDKPLTSHLKGADLRSCGFSNDLGLLYIVPGTCMPYVKSLQQEYMERHEINLSAALQESARIMTRNNHEGEAAAAAAVVGPWILHWTRLMAQCVQLLSVLKEPKIAACIPESISKSIKTIMDQYSPFGDALDLSLFERTCIQQNWMVDQIMLGKHTQAAVSNAVASGDSTGGDIIQLCIVESINRMRRRSGITRASSMNASDILKKLPADYACQIMDAATDGLGMAIRLKNAGACIRIVGTHSSAAAAAQDGSSAAAGGRKRGRTLSSSSANNNGGVGPRPIFSDTIDFATMREEEEVAEEDEEDNNNRRLRRMKRAADVANDDNDDVSSRSSSQLSSSSSKLSLDREESGGDDPPMERSSGSDTEPEEDNDLDD